MKTLLLILLISLSFICKGQPIPIDSVHEWVPLDSLGLMATDTILYQDLYYTKYEDDFTFYFNGSRWSTKWSSDVILKLMVTRIEGSLWMDIQNYDLSQEELEKLHDYLDELPNVYAEPRYYYDGKDYSKLSLIYAIVIYMKERKTHSSLQRGWDVSDKR